MSIQPTKQQVHIDQPLTNFTVAAMQSSKDFVSAQVLPSLAVRKQTDRYFKYNSGDFARDAAKRRAAGTESAGTGFNLSSDSYLCEKYALHIDFDLDTLANADDALQLEQAGAEQLALAMLIRKEKLFSDVAFATASWTTTLVGNASTQWSSYTTSDPIIAMDAAKKAIRQKIFVEPNVLILGEEVFLKLKEHTDIVSRIQYTANVNNAIINEDALAKLFGIEKVIVAKALVNNASEGLTDSNATILGEKNALLAYLPSTVGLMTKSAMVSFEWTGADHLPRAGGVATRRFDMESTLSRRVETEIALDVKVTNADAGYYFLDIVA